MVYPAPSVETGRVLLAFRVAVACGVAVRTGVAVACGVAVRTGVAVVCGVAVGCAVAVAAGVGELAAATTVLATVVLIYAGYSNAGSPVHRLLSHRWLAGIGRCSYSLYLWHIVPLLLLEKAGLGLSRPILGVMAVAATIVLTALSYQFLERPFLRPRSDVLRPAAVDRPESPDRQAA